TNSGGRSPVMTNALRAIIIYEHRDCGERAREVLRRINTRSQLGLAIHSDAWNFEGLQRAELRDHAARQAAEADMVLLAGQNPDQLPRHVRDWLQGWLPQRKEHAAAFVAIFEDPAHPEQTSYRAWLLEMAERGNTDLFWQSGT